MGLFDRLKQGLSKTKEALVSQIRGVVAGRVRIDEDLYEELEEILIRGDVGVSITQQLLDDLRGVLSQRRVSDPEQVPDLLRELIEARLGQAAPLNLQPAGLSVILVVGVNGVGKTTTIGKLAHRLKQDGQRVLLAAGDTFRAAAIEQLEIWAGRAGVELIRQQEGSDPAAVAYDAIQAARARRATVLIIDTAGRLHTKTNLMEELKKVWRVVDRELPGAPHEVLLVLDAATGQNAVQQARLFRQAVQVTGVVLTKLDGTARGGVVIAVAAQEGVPVKFIGVGEGIDDLQPFDPASFARALFDAGPAGAATGQ